jgi:hypothetical protein
MGGNFMVPRRTARSDDSCGCAMGAKFMSAGLAASSAYWFWQVHAGEASLGGALAGVLIVTFAAMGAGKIVGIFRHRYRHRLNARPKLTASMRTALQRHTDVFTRDAMTVVERLRRSFKSG